MIKIKEYPPVISIKKIIEDELVGAKSYPTVVKRLKELQIKIGIYDMINTKELFDSLLPKENVLPHSPLIIRKSEPFSLRKK